MSITSWSDAKKVHNFPALKRDLRAKVAIVGGAVKNLSAFAKNAGK